MTTTLLNTLIRQAIGNVDMFMDTSIIFKYVYSHNMHLIVRVRIFILFIVKEERDLDLLSY